MNRVQSADGVVVSYEVTGAGEPPLALVHGWATDRRIWSEEVARLGARHRVVTPDLAGHGKSGAGRTDWSIERFGQDVAAVIEAVGAKQVILVGHSMGGLVVLEAARRMRGRVKGIVVVDMLLDAEQQSSADEIEGAVKQLEADYRTATTEMANQYLFTADTPAAARERVLGYALALPPDRSIAMLRSTWAYDPLPALNEIRVPVRAVNGDKFPTNLEVNRKHMPGFEAAIVAGSGHYPMLEDPARFGAALDRMLSSVMASKD
jgi:pimeloyl-ACP methyl ester carboxylesterase